jgi:hypothetical protein
MAYQNKKNMEDFFCVESNMVWNDVNDDCMLQLFVYCYGYELNTQSRDLTDL